MYYKKTFRGEDAQIYTEAAAYDESVGSLTIINGASISSGYKRSKLEVYLLEAFRETLTEAGYTVEDSVDFAQCLKIQELDLELQIYAATVVISGKIYLYAYLATKHLPSNYSLQLPSLMGPSGVITNIAEKDSYEFTITLKGNKELLQVYSSTYNSLDSENPLFFYSRGVYSAFDEEEYGLLSYQNLQNLYNDSYTGQITFDKYFKLSEDGAAVRTEARNTFSIDKIRSNAYAGMEKLDSLHYVLTNLWDLNLLFSFRHVYVSYDKNMQIHQFYNIGGELYVKVNAFMLIKV